MCIICGFDLINLEEGLSSWVQLCNFPVSLGAYFCISKPHLLWTLLLAGKAIVSSISLVFRFSIIPGFSILGGGGFGIGIHGGLKVFKLRPQTDMRPCQWRCSVEAGSRELCKIFEMGSKCLVTLGLGTVLHHNQDLCFRSQNADCFAVQGDRRPA